MNYILFEKKSDNEHPAWTRESIHHFCEEQKIESLGVVEESQFFVVKTSEHDEEQKFRLLEVTPTITFLLRDDPSLDEFMEAEYIHPRTVEIDEKE